MTRHGGVTQVAIARLSFMALWLVLTVFPLYWIIITALKAPSAIYTFPVQYWPPALSFQNFTTLFTKADFITYMQNSLIVAILSASVVTGIALFSGYVLARFAFRGKGAVMAGFLVTQMIPGFIALGPLYMLMTDLGLIDSRAGLVLVYIALNIPFATLMIIGFLENVPADLEEAAMIDGCSRAAALLRVIVPVALPGISATFLLSFVASWNELFLSVTLINSDGNRTIPSALNSFITSYNIDWGPLAAAAVLTMVPTVVVFAWAGRYMVAGLSSGAVKG